jgi:hypothetical protein
MAALSLVVVCQCGAGSSDRHQAFPQVETLQGLGHAVEAFGQSIEFTVRAIRDPRRKIAFADAGQIRL